MIKNSVVLILGAGASIPYGFPSGASLTAQILDELNVRGREFTRDIESCGFEPGMITKFRQEFYQSSQLSIDAFLEHRKEFIEIGKICIARALIPREKDNLARGVERHWYQHLLQQLDAPPQHFDQNRLCILTYNYDRSLEQYLFTAFKSRYGLSDADAATLVRFVPIYHLHGDLGKLPVLEGTGRAYEPTISTDILKQCASSIKIISEDIAEHGEFHVPQEIIQDAHTICFLGFGFHPLNLERLFHPIKPEKTETVYASTFGLPPSEGIRVNNWFASKGFIFQNGDYDALGLLHQWHILK